MNRKKKQALEQKESKIIYDHLYNDERLWPGANFTQPPLSEGEIKAFQKRINSAFGAENAIVLAWSGDRQYWDEFYSDWYGNGLPKPNSLEKSPILLFYRFKINEFDYYDISVPRWMLLERLHPAQYSAGWESASWLSDPDMLGGKKLIRTAQPPPVFYRHLRTLGEHDDVITKGDTPFCCREMFESLSKICYGKYRPTAEIDLEYVRTIRENMDKAGVTQRNDEKLGAKVLQDAAASTKVYIESARRQRAQKTRNFIMENIPVVFADILERGKLSCREIEQAVKEGLNKKDEQEFRGNI